MTDIITTCVRFFIRKCDSFIKKCDNFITNCDRRLFKTQFHVDKVVSAAKLDLLLTTKFNIFARALELKL